MSKASGKNSLTPTNATEEAIKKTFLEEWDHIISQTKPDQHKEIRRAREYGEGFLSYSLAIHRDKLKEDV